MSPPYGAGSLMMLHYILSAVQFISCGCIIALVLILSVLLDRLLLRPLTHVMREREGAIRSARELAESSRAKAQSAADRKSVV